MERRELLKWLVATTGLHALDALAPADLLALARGVHREAVGGSQALRVLSPAQERTVAAAAERIIPATDTPGATDANVSQFVDRMLAEAWTSSHAAKPIRWQCSRHSTMK
jgi:gluconate 2-dehydrogenase gamma chain